MSSRFWQQKGAGSGSSSEQDDESDSGSSVGGQDKVQQRRQWALESDSESEDEVRVVKSAKDRAWEAVRSAVSKCRAKMKINDWNGIQTDFEDLNKHVTKNQANINKEGIPNFYIKLLTDLEDFLAETLKAKEAVKKMSATNTRALNRMKLTLKKHNKAYEEDIAKCRADPSAYEEAAEESSAESSEGSSDSDSEDSDASSEDSEDSPPDESDDSAEKSDAEEESGDDSDAVVEGGSDDEVAKPAKVAKPARKSKPDKALDEMDSDDWPSESESESDDESDQGDMPKGRAFWLKKNVDDDKKKKKDEKKAAKMAGAEGQEKRTKKEKVIEVRLRSGGTIYKFDEDMKSEDFDKKLLEVLAARGRKGSDPKDVLRQLQALAYVSRRFGPVKEIPVVMHLISAMFDTLRNIDDYLDVGTWKSCHGYLMRVVKVLEAHPIMRLGQVAQEDMADLVLASRGEVRERPDDINEEASRTGVIKVVGTLLVLVQRLEEEYTKSVQQINPHTSEYISRLRDEASVVSLAAEVQKYYERQGDTKAASIMSLLQVEHMYYKHDSIALAVFRAQAFSSEYGNPSDLHPACTGNPASAEAVKAAVQEGDWANVHPAGSRCASIRAATTPLPAGAPDYSKIIADLCTYIYTHGDDRCKTRAMLCHIYHHALHDRFYAARDMLLMSHLQDAIGHADVATQILYNRMLVTLGLCAFRAGLIAETHDCLRDVCSSRVKELLAQGVQMGRFQDKNPEQEKAERRRQVPYHMHINLDLLECCHLTAAMLLEVPNMAQEENDASRRRVLSKQFRRFLDIYNRQVFTGPPENIRDHVIAAAKCLSSGEWERCAELLLTLDVWALVPGQGAAERVKAMLKEKLQVEALRTYLFTYAAYYESLSLPRLCAMFGVSKAVAHSVISKMMINQELYGSWDQPTETIVLHKVEPSHLQLLALQFADKAATLVESNERLLDSRTGGYGYRNDKNWGRSAFGGGANTGNAGNNNNSGNADWGDRKGGFSSDKWKAAGTGGAYRGGSGGGGRGGSGGGGGGGGGRGGSGGGSYLGRGTANYRGDRVQRDEKRSRGLF